MQKDFFNFLSLSFYLITFFYLKFSKGVINYLLGLKNVFYYS